MKKRINTSRSDSNLRKLSFLAFNPKFTNNDDPNEVQLDAEMEKVFAPPGKVKDKFELKKLSDAVTVDISALKFDENDYETHRTSEYPQSSIHHKPSIRSLKHEESPHNEPPEYESLTPTTAPTSPISYKSETSRSDLTRSEGSNHTTIADNISVEFSVGETIGDDEPQVCERTNLGLQWDSTTKKNVHFNRGRKNATIEGLSAEETNEEKRRRSERHHHHKSRKFSLQEHHPEWKRQGSAEGTSRVRRISVQPEDAALQEADIDDLTSHRSDDPRALRRHKVQGSSHMPYVPSVININRKEGNAIQNLIPLNKLKKMYDHSPHEVFVQLDELIGIGEDREWKETARWIKYEEDVEEGADRWGRPHVASLSFHSLLNLRRCLETGVVLMDLEEKDLPAVAYRIVEQMVTDELIHEDDKPVVMRALLLRHRHVNDHSHTGFHFGAKRKYSSYSSLQNVQSTDSDRKPRIVPLNEINGHSFTDTKISINEETYTSSQEDLKIRTKKESILTRIPEGAEATTVLVGAVDFLEQPTIAFVRLAEGIIMPNITEVPIPVRFLFVLMGPKTVELDYHEVGRSIATLMANEHFHSIAYRAEDRRELLSAINEFLDDSIVLPPGKWERQALLPFDELKAKSDMIRLRKKKALDEKIKSKEYNLTKKKKKKKKKK